MGGLFDALAQRHSLSVSGLAKRAGLKTPTTFNKSKRYAADGRARWPSTEIHWQRSCKQLALLWMSSSTLVHGKAHSMLLAQRCDPSRFWVSRKLVQADFSTMAAFLSARDGMWSEFPIGPDDAVYALGVSGDSMLPLYRDGDTIIVAPGAAIRRGDRVVVRTKDGEVMAKILSRQTPRTIELQSMKPRAYKQDF